MFSLYNQSDGFITLDVKQKEQYLSFHEFKAFRIQDQKLLLMMEYLLYEIIQFLFRAFILACKFVQRGL